MFQKALELNPYLTRAHLNKKSALEELSYNLEF
jgi:hypothetical protein